MQPAGASDSGSGVAATRSHTAAPSRPRLVPGGYDLAALPLFVPPVEGEQLASWLTRWAYRYGMPVSQLLPQVGIDVTSASAARVEHQLRRRHAATLTAVAGVPKLPPHPSPPEPSTQVSRQLEGYLDRYHQRARPPAEAIRFCPPCLAESNGVWLARWTRPLHLVCVTHKTILRRTCPDCGQARFASGAWMTHDTPPWTCSEPSGSRPRGARGARTRYPVCGRDLRTATAAAADDVEVATQRRLWDMAAAAANNPDRQDRSYGGLLASNRDAFDAVLELVFERFGDLRPLTSSATAPGPLMQALRTAMQVLDQPNAAAAVAAADPLRLLHPGGAVTPIGPERALTARARNPLLASIRLATLHERFPAGTQLAFRTGSDRPRYPKPPVWPAASDQAQLAWIPQLIWRGPLGGWIDERDYRDRAAASMLLAKVGSTRPWRFIALDLGLPAEFATHPANLVRYLKREGHWPAVLHCLDDLASDLEAHPPPIDYQRRRWTAARYDDVIAAVNHTVAYLGPPYPWCHTHLLVELFWQAYTGGDLRLAAPATGTLLNPDLYHQHDGDIDPLTDPRLLAFFTAAAATLNQATEAATEPLTWQPP